MRQLTANARSVISQRTGLEPINVIGIAWDGAHYVYYADKDFAGIPGKVLEVGAVDDVQSLSGSSGSSQVSVTVDDSDGSIRDLLGRFDPQKKPVKILQAFTGMQLADAFTVFFGAMSTPITWSEGERKFSFEAVSRVEAGGMGLFLGTSGEVGFSPEECQFADVSPQLWGKTWPLAFGDTVYVPCVKSFQRSRGATATGFGIRDHTLPFKYWHLVERLSILARGFNYYITLANACRTLIGTQPVDLSQLFEAFTWDHLEDVARNVDPTDIESVSVATNSDPGSADSQKNYRINYLNRVTVAQLGTSDKNVLIDLTTAVQVVNQMEVSYASLIVTEQRTKQDHEDIAAFIHAFDKSVDKFSNLIQNAPTRQRQDLIDVVSGIINYLNKQITVRNITTQELVRTQVVVPNSQSAAFSLTPPQDVVQSETLLLLQQSITEGVRGLETLKQQLATAPPNQFQTLLTAASKLLSDVSTQQKVLINSVTQVLLKVQGAKERLEIDMDNCEYAVKTLREIDKKIWKTILDYNKTTHELWKVMRAIGDQAAMQTTVVQVADNNLFPRGSIRLNINNTIFRGVLSGSAFTVQAIEPKYANIRIGPRQTDEVDCFWVADASIILKGCYCLRAFNITPSDPDWDFSGPVTQVRWRVFKVKEQYGTKCVIELIENRSRRAPKPAVKITPILQDLPLDVEAMFIGAKAHTRQEIVRILENSLEKYEQNKLQNLRSIVEKLAELATRAVTADDLAAVNETITKDVNEYNARVSKLRFKKETIDKCKETMTDKERTLLLKMENLKINMLIEGVDNTPDRMPPQLNMYYITGYDITSSIAAASDTMLPSWFNFSPQGQELVDNDTILALPNNQFVTANYLPDSAFWYAPPGSPVYVADDTTETYIASILPSEVLGVYGYSSVGGVQTLVPLRSDMCVINEADTNYAPLTCTSIVLRQPLSAYNLGFRDEVYVCLRSSVGGTAADVIKWIVQNWTNLSVDAASFLAASLRLAFYPVNFALLQKKDALKLIQDIAWESRCAVYVKNEVVYIQYLAELPVAVDAIRESDVRVGTLEVELTTTENISTKFIASWRQNYVQSQDDKTVVTLNVARYGFREQHFNFFTYNVGSLVLKSLTFWATRYGNCWKRVKFQTFLHKLSLETFDWVLLDFGQQFFSSQPIVAMVEKAVYDSASNLVTVQCWTPVRSGETTPYAYAHPADLPVATIFPPPQDIVLGLAGNYQNSRVPTNVPFKITSNANLVDQMKLAPKDYGGVQPSDAFDKLPPSPLQGLVLSSFLSQQDISNYNLPIMPRVETPNQGRPGLGYTYERGVDRTSTTELNRTSPGSASTPMRETFQGRVEQTVDAGSGTYLVRASDGRQYSVEQRTGTAPLLPAGQVVTVHRDSTLNRYTMNETTAGNAGTSVTYLAEVTATSNSGVQPTYQAVIFGDDYDSTQGPTASFPTYPAVGLQMVTSVSGLPFFNGELVAVNQVNGVWFLQKLEGSALAQIFSRGQVSVRGGYTSKFPVASPNIFFDVPETTLGPIVSGVFGPVFNGSGNVFTRINLQDTAYEYLDIYGFIYELQDINYVSVYGSLGNYLTPSLFARGYLIPFLQASTTSIIRTSVNRVITNTYSVNNAVVTYNVPAVFSGNISIGFILNPAPGTVIGSFSGTASSWTILASVNQFICNATPTVILPVTVQTQDGDYTLGSTTVSEQFAEVAFAVASIPLTAGISNTKLRVTGRILVVVISVLAAGQLSANYVKGLNSFTGNLTNTIAINSNYMTQVSGLIIDAADVGNYIYVLGNLGYSKTTAEVSVTA